MRTLLVALLLGVVPLTGLAAPFDEALGLYMKAADEKEPAREKFNEQAQEAFQKLVDVEPANPLYLAYLGSTWVMKGRDAFAPWNKMKHAERGLALLDKSVSLLEPSDDSKRSGNVPVSVRVRGIAAISYIRLPDNYFKRLDQGNVALQQLADSPLLKTVAGPDKAYIYYFAGEAARLEKNTPQAKVRYETALALAPTGAYAARSQQALSDIQKK